MINCRLGGVPEHFNYPWHYGIRRQLFGFTNIELIWIDCKGGTGQMALELQNGNLDAAIMLSEGAWHFCNLGYPLFVQQVYVESPLVWGIHVAQTSPISQENEIFSRKYAISRPGSGSQLMAALHAKKNNYKIHDDQWVTVQNLEGAISSLSKQESEIFFWEKYTTLPFVKNGLLRRIGEFPTPWPCFVLVFNRVYYQMHMLACQSLSMAILEVVNKMLKEIDIIQQISEFYNMPHHFVASWYPSVRWSTKYEPDAWGQISLVIEENFS